MYHGDYRADISSVADAIYILLAACLGGFAAVADHLADLTTLSYCGYNLRSIVRATASYSVLACPSTRLQTVGYKSINRSHQSICGAIETFHWH